MLTINGKNYGINDLVNMIKIKGQDTVLRSLVQRAILEQAAVERKIEISAEELQGEADLFRRQNGLFTVKEAEVWLGANSMALEDLEKELELKLISDQTLTLVLL